jgi:hypothetical protein
MVTLTVFGLLFTCAASIAGLLTMIGDGPRWVVVVPVLVAALPPWWRRGHGIHGLLD